VRVSSHLLIRRDGAVLQFVPFHRRAWHAGVSEFHGRTACNDYSIGIELEGTDTSPYTGIQYITLAAICRRLMQRWSLPTSHIVGHSDIAPGRKTDPGPAFNWAGFRKLLTMASEG
ncbi:MAG: 1,6-anhydro-N-acetylmuramyl-L-alanine amidase AmpD, partial [Pseudomonadales bacterium]|nr:1,6-anhydro-N-acetylmuramyl-L-alanine amidase AmpD [Pseudomonadales bacterium]